jgi:O-antigen biosynthesis protein
LIVSIFTPTHDLTYIMDTFNSIKDQSYDEWVLFPNNGVTINDFPEEIKEDPRTIFVAYEESNVHNIGALKRIACSACEGDILIELDHDDTLTPDAVLKIKDDFIDPEVVFVYSNCAQYDNYSKLPRFFGNATTETNKDTLYGWTYQDYIQDGIIYKAAVCPDADPYHVSCLLFAPDHVRAFRKSAYNQVGGYDASLSVCDDSDLMCRLYLSGKFKHINECLYMYRVHGENSWLQRNAIIQKTFVDVQKKYFRSMVIKWARDNSLSCIDLGGRFDCPPDFISVDLKDAQINCNLNEEWPFDDSSIGVIRAFDIIEHLDSPLHVMSEIHRVLCPGGYVCIEVPSTDGRGAWQDPSHRSGWNENSFLYYTNRRQAKYIDNETIRFKPVIVETYYPNDWCEAHKVPYVRADLMCLKDGLRPRGVVEI